MFLEHFGSKKAIIVSSVCSLPIMDATIASKAQIAGYLA